MSSNFQRTRRAIEAASAEHIADILRILPAPMAIPQTYVPPSTILKNGLTWSILIDHISQTFVFLQGHKAGHNFHAGKYLVFSSAEWLGAEQAWRETRPGLSGAFLGAFPEDALDLDTWTETRGESPLPPGIEKWNPYHEVAFADSPNGDESEGFPIPAPQWAGGTYRVVHPEMTVQIDTRMNSDVQDWVLREAARLNVVRLAHKLIDMRKEPNPFSSYEIAREAMMLARHVLALLEDMAFLSADAAPAVNPVPAADKDGDA